MVPWKRNVFRKLRICIHRGEGWEFGFHSALITVGNHPCEEEWPNKGSYPVFENVILHTSLHPYVFCLDLVYRISTAKFLILMVFGRTLSQRAASRFHHVGRGDKPLWVINGPNHSAKWTTIIFPLFNEKF